MQSKAEWIRECLAGLRVLDLGGVGYEEPNAYERELEAAWACCRERVSVDCSPNAGIRADLNGPLPAVDERFDIATAFDVLEHLERPVDVLRWIPSDRILVTVPNALSWFARRMEERFRSKHLYSFTPYTATILMGEGGWRVKRLDFQFGKWSLLARAIHAVGSLVPSRVGTGIVLYAERGDPDTAWRLR